MMDFMAYTDILCDAGVITTMQKTKIRRLLKQRAEAEMTINEWPSLNAAANIEREIRHAYGNPDLICEAHSRAFPCPSFPCPYCETLKAALSEKDSG